MRNVRSWCAFVYGLRKYAMKQDEDPPSFRGDACAGERHPIEGPASQFHGLTFLIPSRQSLIMFWYGNMGMAEQGLALAFRCCHHICQ